MGFIPLIIREISLAPRLSMTVKMLGHAIDELIRLLMSFIKSVCLVIEKVIESGKMTFSMPYFQLNVSCDKRINTIITLGYIGSLI